MMFTYGQNFVLFRNPWTADFEPISKSIGMYCMEQGKCKTVFLSIFSRLIAPGDNSTIFSLPIKLKKSNFALVKLRGSFEKLLLSSVSDVILVVVHMLVFMNI